MAGGGSLLATFLRSCFMRIKPFFNWRDLYVGLYVDDVKKYAYLLVLPTLGLRIDLQSGSRCRECGKPLDGDEIKYLEHTCSRCEQQPWDAIKFRGEVLSGKYSELMFDGARLPRNLEIGMIIKHNFGDPIMDEEEACRVLAVTEAKDMFQSPVYRINVKMLALIHNGEERQFDVRPDQTIPYYKYEETPANG
jgi:hypothetical protein